MLEDLSEVPTNTEQPLYEYMPEIIKNIGEKLFKKYYDYLEFENKLESISFSLIMNNIALNQNKKYSIKEAKIAILDIIYNSFNEKGVINTCDHMKNFLNKKFGVIESSINEVIEDIFKDITSINKQVLALCAAYKFSEGFKQVPHEIFESHIVLNVYQDHLKQLECKYIIEELSELKADVNIVEQLNLAGQNFMMNDE
ncbi:MAG: hypothetical protein K0R02_899 [Rickettsiaceae bacterium]|jgi:hypothetical protein|nr:hypothetical protein [Rickettsiaceae bacterium]